MLAVQAIHLMYGGDACEATGLRHFPGRVPLLGGGDTWRTSPLFQKERF